ncbi:permease-like cell division protein FtsX [Eionea flava]
MNRRVSRPATAKPAANTYGASKKAANKKASSKSQGSWFSSQVSFASSSSLVSSKKSGGSSSAPLNAWLAHHRFSCLDSLQRLLNTPWQSLATGLVVAIALVLPTLLYIVFEQARPLQNTWQNNTQISLYIEPKTQPLAVDKLQQRLLATPTINAVEVVTPEMAKQDFQQHSGLGNILSSLETNPLPYVLLVKPRINDNEADASPELLANLQAQLAAEPLVEEAQLDTQWLRRLQEMANLAQRIVFALALLLAVGVILVIGNTIRLSIESRRNEIVVIKMVGGTDGFIKRPFLYTGFWYGLSGAILSLLILGGVQMWLAQPIKHLTALYGSEYTLSLLSIETIALVIVVASSLGWLGAWLSVSRHLRQIEPE